MWMELQDKKRATGDFLSLYKDPSFQDSRPPSQGIFPRTRDFLQPLERAEAGGGGRQRAAPGGETSAAATAEHVPPARLGSRGADPVHPAAVKPEWSTCAAPGAAESAERKAEAKRNAFTLWEEEPAWPREGRGGFAGKGSLQQHQQQRWLPPSPFPAARGATNGSFPSFPSTRCGHISSSSPLRLRRREPGGSLFPSLTGVGAEGCCVRSREQSAEDKRRPMVTASISERGFADGVEGEEDFGMEEKPYHKEVTVKVGGGTTSKDDNLSQDQKSSTPRSKHSATEQRRRTKINDRFQVLRDLIPHSDQKKDKASFLLEVIEYIQFLQEKAQKYESSCLGWNQANAKLMPWKNGQAPGASIVDHSHIIKDHPASTSFIFHADSTILNAPIVMSSNQSVAESDNPGAGLACKSASMPIPMQYPVGHGSGFSQPPLKIVSDSESMAAQPRSQWLRRSPAMDASASTDVLSGHEELTVDEGKTSLSSLYSERLLSTLRQALQCSGVDISQASISVQINLHRRATSRRISSNKVLDDPISSNQAGHLTVGSSRDESERARKRHKFDTS